MPKITQIQNLGQKVIVYMDHKYGASIKQNVWRYMNLCEGSEITCSELKRKSFFYRKKDFMFNVWNREQERIDSVAEWLFKYLPEVEIKRITPDKEPSMKGYNKIRSNLSLLARGAQTELVSVKVLGADVQAGNHYWIRLDAIEYVKRNPSRDIWLAVCFKYPKFKITWIKLEQNKEYHSTEKDKEGFIYFDNLAPECYASSSFCE